MTNDKPKIGEYVTTVHSVSGILTAIKSTYYGDMAFIATADMRTFHCPVSEVRRISDGKKDNHRTD